MFNLIELEKILKDKGFDLDGHLPNLFTKFYTIEILDDKVNIYWGFKHQKLKKCKKDVIDIVTKLFTIHKNLKDKPFDENKFLENLLDIYLKNTDKIGEPLNISYFLKYYDRVTLSYFLYLLKKRIYRNYKISLVIATRSFTNSINNFIWLPLKENNIQNSTYISHIRFRLVDHQ